MEIRSSSLALYPKTNRLASQNRPVNRAHQQPQIASTTQKLPQQRNYATSDHRTIHPQNHVPYQSKQAIESYLDTQRHQQTEQLRHSLGIDTYI